MYFESAKMSFGSFVIDVDCRELGLGGELVEIQPKVFTLLSYLIANRQRVVLKGELLDTLWPETVVPCVLTTAMRSLRRALRDDARSPRYVRTVHSVGYRFIAPVSSTGERDGSSRALPETFE